MIRRPPRCTQSRSSAASDVYKRQGPTIVGGLPVRGTAGGELCGDLRNGTCPREVRAIAELEVRFGRRFPRVARLGCHLGQLGEQVVRGGPASISLEAAGSLAEVGDARRGNPLLRRS